MKTFIVALIALLPMWVFAQHEGHVMPPTKKTTVKKAVTKKPVVKKATSKKKVAATKSKGTSRRTTTSSSKKKTTSSAKKKTVQTKGKRTTTSSKSSQASAKKKAAATAHKGHVTTAKTKQSTQGTSKSKATTQSSSSAKKTPGQAGHAGHGTPAKTTPTTTDPSKKPVAPPAHQGHETPPATLPKKQEHQGHEIPPTGAGQPPKQEPQQHQGHGATAPAPAGQGLNPVFAPPEPFPQYDKRGWPKPVMDDEKFRFTLFERLEYLPSGGGGNLAWDVLSWHGGDYRRIWIKSEGGLDFAEKEGEGDLEIHYGRLVKPFYDFLTGVRVDGKWGGENRARLSVGAGVQGLAPYVFETEAFVYLSQNGQVYFNGALTRDFYLTQRLVLQPRAETNLALNSDKRFGSEAGLQDIDLSLRLRYEIRREFAPYIGVSARWLFGDTASAARVRGESSNRYRVMFGLRFWF